MESKREIQAINFDDQIAHQKYNFTRTTKTDRENQDELPHLFSARFSNLEPPSSTTRIIRLSQLTEILSISRSCIYDWLNPRSPRHDPSFPKQIHLTGRTHGGAVGWRLDSIITWIESRSRSTSSLIDSKPDHHF